MRSIPIKKVDILLVSTGLAFAFVAPYLAYLQRPGATVSEITGELWPMMALGAVGFLCALARN